METFYTVRQGDSVYQISQRYGVPVTVIAEENKLAPPYILRVGMQLVIPGTGTDVLKQEFTSETFGVNFQYPASWHRVSDVRYEGEDGFFQISALFGSNDIEKVCHAVAFQQSLPYGSTPRIIQSQNPYEQTCTILPSSDQPANRQGLAAFIAVYPSLMEIDGRNYNYFILWADQGHIEGLAATVLFLP